MTSFNVSGDPNPTQRKFRALIVPDYLPWVTGKIAKRIAQHNHDWLDATVCSGGVLSEVVERSPDLLDRIDLVHFQTRDVAEALIDRFAGKVPVVLTIHHVEENRCVALEPRCDAIGTAGSQWAGELLAHGINPQKIVRIPYGVDVEQFRPPSTDDRARIRGRLGIDSDRFTIGFCAKRSSDSSGRKGVEVLIAAIELLGRRMPKAALVITGPGWSDVVARARNVGLQCVQLPYIWDEAEYAETYWGLDTFWVTSRIEGGPVPLLEAMSTGVCCITTPVGMTVDVVRDRKNGFFVPFNDPETVISRTEELVRDPELARRLSHAARQTIINGYRWDQVTRSASTLYRAAAVRFQERTGKQYSPAAFIPDHEPPATHLRESELELNALPRGLWPLINLKERFHFIMILRWMGEDETAERLIAEANSSRLPSRHWKEEAARDSIRRGWEAFGKGDRRRALRLGLSAVGESPWLVDSWRLLVCALVKPLP